MHLAHSSCMHHEQLVLMTNTPPHWQQWEGYMADSLTVVVDGREALLEDVQILGQWWEYREVVVWIDLLF